MYLELDLYPHAVFTEVGLLALIRVVEFVSLCKKMQPNWMIYLINPGHSNEVRQQTDHLVNPALTSILSTDVLATGQQKAKLFKCIPGLSTHLF